MPVIIKKISRKTMFSLIAFFGLALGFFGRIFLGAPHSDLSRLNSAVEKMTPSISIAHADVPTPYEGSGDSCECGGGSGSGGDDDG